MLITGIGLATPLGSDRESTWRRLCGGESGLAWVDPQPRGLFAGGRSSHKLAGGLVPQPSPGESGDSQCDLDPVVQLALRVAGEAVADAGIDLGALPRERLACVIGTSKGSLRSFARAFGAEREAGGLHESATSALESHSSSSWQQFWPNAPAAAVAARFGVRGACLCPVAACATGLTCLVRGAELVRCGACDMVLAGSSDAALCPSVAASFGRLGVLARVADDPAVAVRPFDRRRSGFLVGEGAAVLVLERAEHAAARGAPVYAEWLAHGLASDPAGITQLSADAAPLARLIQDVLRRAALLPGEIDYVNLHGTATRANDLCETQALRAALGPAADSASCSAFKGALGHLLGAAGSAETAATVLAVRDGVIPPTINLDDPDPLCDLDYTPRQARCRRVRHALKLSLGFGGHLVAAVVRGV